MIDLNVQEAETPDSKMAALLEFLTGMCVVASGVALVWLIGYLAEPYMQWMPAIADLNTHAWYSEKAAPNANVGRSLYVGGLVLLSVGVVGVMGVVAAGVLDQVRILGKFVLRRE